VQWTNPGCIGIFTGTVMFYEVASQTAEDETGNQGEQKLGKHEFLSFGLNGGLETKTAVTC
jgi:hypothetical protein